MVPPQPGPPSSSPTPTATPAPHVPDAPASRRTAADRLYGWLLHLYPRAFRERFGDDMRDLFHDRSHAAHRVPFVIFWMRTVADLVRHAVAERIEQARAHWFLRVGQRGVTAFRRADDVIRSPISAAPLRFLTPALLTPRKDRPMMSLAYDLRYAARSLRRQPAFTIIAVITLALGIGANATIFSIVNALLFKPLPYPDADRIVSLRETTPAGAPDGVSFLNLEDWRTQSRTLEQAGVFQGQTVNLTGQEQPDRLRGGFVSSGFFEVLGARPHLGRLLTTDDDRDGAAKVAVLQYTAWQVRYAGRADVIGQTLILNNVPHVVIGIAPPGFAFPLDETEIWIPVRDYSSTLRTSRGDRIFLAVAKVRPGVSLEQARADLHTVADQLASQYPNDNAGRSVTVSPLQQLLVQDARPALLVLFAAVGCVLLIACVNLANLVLARGAGRGRELSVRAALGASRWRLLRLLLLESLVLGVLGGIAGFALAYGGVATLLQFAPDVIPRRNEIAVDGHVLLFTFTMSLVTGLLCGLMPGIRLSRADLQDALRAGARGTERRETAWTRHALVVCDIALSLMLLVGAGLLTRTLISLIAQSPGFAPDHLFSLEYRIPRNKYTTADAQWTFHQQVIARVRQVPGVQAAALVRGLSFTGNGGSIGFALPGENVTTDAARMRQALYNTITADYLQTMGIPLFAGRTCGPQDTATAPAAAVVNRYLAQQMWPQQSAIGKTLLVQGNTTLTVIGVAGSTKQSSLAEPERPQINACYSQQPGTFATLVARTSVDPLTVANAVKAAIWSVDRDQPVWKLRTMEWLLNRAVAPTQFVMWLMIGAAALALLLALVGIYGVMSYNVSRQTREIGLRMALGADARDILRLVLGRGVWLTLIGLALGLAGARWMAGLLGTLLYGVTASDLTTYAIVAVLLGTVSMLACYLPARRAMRVNPIKALHAD
jgi:putative ABC transport system permease protein